MSGRIVKVDGPLVVAEGIPEAGVANLVRIGKQRLLGEILAISGGLASIQVFEDTRGLGPGAEVDHTGNPLTIELGPGLLDNVFDGLQRPLAQTSKQDEKTDAPVPEVHALDRARTWEFTPAISVGDEVAPGSVIGTVSESSSVTHKIMTPPGVEGVVDWIRAASFTVEQTVCRIITHDGQTRDINMIQKWPVHSARPFLKKLAPHTPLCTGQRAIDTLFPIAKGGSAAVTGPPLTGKTTLLRQIAKWSDADVVVYVCCGERGSEIADLLMELPDLRDPRTGQPLMARTVLIAHTSDMPVAAREPALFTGLSIAEYYRDMGYNVALIADSITRWAEALRDVSGRLGEAPAERGYPAYLTSRVMQFFERAGSFECMGGDGRRATLTIIGAISPPARDDSDPVVQAASRAVKSFWRLDAEPGNARHFPPVDCFSSFSQSREALKPWYEGNFGSDFNINSERALALLGIEAELRFELKRDGYAALSAPDRINLETAKMIREDFLQQNAFDAVDACSTYERQATLLSLILYFSEMCKEAFSKGVSDIRSLFGIPAFQRISRAKSIPAQEYDETLRSIAEEMELQFEAIIKKTGVDGA